MFLHDDWILAIAFVIGFVVLVYSAGMQYIGAIQLLGIIGVAIILYMIISNL